MVTIEEAQANKELMDIFIKENVGLVGKAIKNLHLPPTEDYVQEGAIGLIKAAKRFDVSFGTAFSTYAISMIEGEIRKYRRDYETLCVTGVRVPREIQYMYFKALRLDHLTDEEICKELNIYMGELNEARRAMEFWGSIDMEIPNKNNGDTPTTLLDMISSPLNVEDEAINRLLLEGLFKNTRKCINNRAVKILRMRLKGLNQQKIADAVGISQVQVSRIIKKIAKSYEKL